MRSVFAFLLGIAAVGRAQAPVPTRSLGPVVATSQPLASANQVRQTANGSVLVNDATSHQVVLFDSLLKTSKVILDSAGPPDRRRYGRGTGYLIPYVGDTTLFLDRTAAALLVIDGSANIIRVAAPPSGTGVTLAATSRPDANGRLLYTVGSGTGRVSPTNPGIRMMVNQSMLVAFDLAKRTVDTLFWIRYDTTLSTPVPPPGQPPPSVTPRLLAFEPPSNQHVVMSDGTIAVVRGLDYRIDWIGPDGTVTQSPRIAHEWKRLTDDDKKRMADSMTVVRDSANTTMLGARGGAGRFPVYDPTGRIIAFTIPTPVTNADGVIVPPPPVPPPPPASVAPVRPELLPDYLPAITSGALSDADNRIWIPLSPTKLPPNTRVYDIVDRSGKLIDRVSVDPSVTIVGFGKGGNVYLFVSDGGVGRLQRVRFR